MKLGREMHIVILKGYTSEKNPDSLSARTLISVGTAYLYSLYLYSLYLYSLYLYSLYLYLSTHLENRRNYPKQWKPDYTDRVWK